MSRRRRVPGRESSKRQGLEVELHLVGLMNSDEASVPGAERVRGKVGEVMGQTASK